jgi:hypothetical protein
MQCSAVKPLFELMVNIFPEWRPVIFKIPNVLPLKEWNFVPALTVE